VRTGEGAAFICMAISYMGIRGWANTVETLIVTTRHTSLSYLDCMIDGWMCAYQSFPQRAVTAEFSRSTSFRNPHTH
jgi:hypothetical protein